MWNKIRNPIGLNGPICYFIRSNRNKWEKEYDAQTGFQLKTVIWTVRHSIRINVCTWYARHTFQHIPFVVSFFHHFTHPPRNAIWRYGVKSYIASKSVVYTVLLPHFFFIRFFSFASFFYRHYFISFWTNRMPT